MSRRYATGRPASAAVAAYLNTALGPQPASSFERMTFEIARSVSTVATRSPSQSACSIVLVQCRCDASVRRSVN